MCYIWLWFCKVEAGGASRIKSVQKCVRKVLSWCMQASGVAQDDKKKRDQILITFKQKWSKSIILNHTQIGAGLWSCTGWQAIQERRRKESELAEMIRIYWYNYILAVLVLIGGDILLAAIGDFSVFNLLNANLGCERPPWHQSSTGTGERGKSEPRRSCGDLLQGEIIHSNLVETRVSCLVANLSPHWQ